MVSVIDLGLHFAVVVVNHLETTRVTNESLYHEYMPLYVRSMEIYGAFLTIVLNRFRCLKGGKDYDLSQVW